MNEVDAPWMLVYLEKEVSYNIFPSAVHLRGVEGIQKISWYRHARVSGSHEIQQLKSQIALTGNRCMHAVGTR